MLSSSYISRRRIGLAAFVAVLLGLVAQPALARRAPSGRTLMEPYSAGPNLEVDAPFAYLGGEPQRLTFAANATEGNVTITLRDATGLAAPFTIDGVANQAYPFYRHVFCGTASFAIDPYTTVSVYPMAGYLSAATAVNDFPSGRDAAACAGAATEGVAIATFTH